LHNSSNGNMLRFSVRVQPVFVGKVHARL
jgi:hypothetical protein